MIVIVIAYLFKFGAREKQTTFRMQNSIPHRYIAIEGNIGAGKTTLCQMIAQPLSTVFL